MRVTTADAGYDSQENHRVGRDGAGVATAIPPPIGRPSERPPAGPCRRVMRERFATATVGRAAYAPSVGRWRP